MDNLDEEKRVEFKTKKFIVDEFDKVLKKAGYNRSEVLTRFMNNVITNPAELQIQKALAESQLPIK